MLSGFRWPINVESSPGMGDSRWKRVPLITWAQAGHYEKFNAKTADKWSWTDVESGARTYALLVQDDSMMPRYEPGAIIIIDPDYEPHHRNIVVFRWKATGEVGCAQLLVDGPNRYLKPHNPDFKSTLIDGQSPQIVFCGTARQIFMTYAN